MTTTTSGRTPASSALSAARRERELDALAHDPRVDVLVIGGGITGAGLALDAASRGLRTVLVERHEEVNEELDDLLARVFERLEA